MLFEHERYYGLGMVALFWYFSEHERYYGLGMVALFIVCSVIVCSRNTNIIMVWAWMHLLSYALTTRTLLWFGHRCFGIRVRSSLKNAMRGIRSISGPRNTSNVWFVPRRPHPERSARCAFFARLRSGGAINNNSITRTQMKTCWRNTRSGSLGRCLILILSRNCIGC